MRTQRLSLGLLQRVSQPAETCLFRSSNPQVSVTQTRPYRYTPLHVFDERNVQLLYSKAEIKEYLQEFITPNETPNPEIEEEQPNLQESRLEQLAQHGRLKEAIFHLKNVSTDTLNRKKTYDLLFKALCKSQEHYKEIPLLRTVFGRTGTLSHEEQVLVVSGLIGRNELSEATRQLDELRKSKFGVPNWVDNFLVQKLIAVDAKKGLDHLYALAEKSPTFQPEFRTHDVVLQHTVVQDLPRAEQYFRDISARFRQTPDNHLYNILINAFVQKGELDHAYQILRSMEPPIRPNLDSFQKLIEEHVFRGNSVVVKKLHTAMENKYKIVPDREYYHGILEATVRRDPDNTRSHFGILLKMRRAGHEPDVRAYNVIFRVAADAGVRKTVNHFFDKLKFRFFDVNEQVPIEMGQDMYPDAESYHLIISGYVKNKFLIQAYEFYRFMQARKVTPLPETVPLIDQILQHHRNYSAIVTPKE